MPKIILLLDSNIEENLIKLNIELEKMINDPNIIDNDTRSDKENNQREKTIKEFNKALELLDKYNNNCNVIKFKELYDNYLKIFIVYEADKEIYFKIHYFIHSFFLEKRVNSIMKNENSEKANRSLNYRRRIMPSGTVRSSANIPNLLNNINFKSDLVEFGCYYDDSISTNSSIVLNFCVFEKKFKEELDLMFKYKVLKGSGKRTIDKEKKYKVLLTSPDISNLKEEQEFIWYGEYTILDYLVDIPNDYNKSDVKFIFTVKSYDLAITNLIISININDKIVNSNYEEKEYAFISYARYDKEFVKLYKNIVEQIGYHAFYDCESLRHGSLWNDEIANAIKKSYCLFLFWSKTSKDSIYVKREYEAMIEAHGIKSIRIIPLYDMNPEELPENLRVLHIDRDLCNDVLEKLNISL